MMLSSDGRPRRAAPTSGLKVSATSTSCLATKRHIKHKVKNPEFERIKSTELARLSVFFLCLLCLFAALFNFHDDER